jgi:hypothetical protein
MSDFFGEELEAKVPGLSKLVNQELNGDAAPHNRIFGYVVIAFEFGMPQRFHVASNVTPEKVPGVLDAARYVITGGADLTYRRLD